MKTLKSLWKKYREVITYVFFGGLTFLLNLVLFTVFQNLFGEDFATGVGNVLNNFICIVVAYLTNRAFVFCSKTTGKAALKEFLSFFACRIGTAVMDQILMWLGVSIIGSHISDVDSLTLFGIYQTYKQLWNFGTKLVSQVLVILFNYIFSKLIIFKKKNA